MGLHAFSGCRLYLRPRYAGGGLRRGFGAPSVGTPDGDANCNGSSSHPALPRITGRGENQPTGQRGWTLVELLVVIGIGALLLGMVVTLGTAVYRAAMSLKHSVR
jgi:prepilin-type N-terminal cleavage/methylation domain-containing protein